MPSRAGFRGGAGAALALCLALRFASGCASGPSPGDAPRQGTVIYHDPAPRGGRRSRVKPRPVLLAYVSLAPSSTAVPDALPEGTEVVVGHTNPLTGLSGSDRLGRGIRPRDLRGALPVRLSAEGFATLWSALAKAGVFDLPELSGQPPADRAYILLDDGEHRRVFVRPEGRTALDLERLKIWGRASQVLLTGTFRENLYIEAPRGTSP